MRRLLDRSGDKSPAVRSLTQLGGPKFAHNAQALTDQTS